MLELHEIEEKVFQKKKIFSAPIEKKTIFKKISDTQLHEYIDSIFYYNDKNKSFDLNFSRRWEEQIFLKSLYDDMLIWNNLDKLYTPTLILRPDSNPEFRDRAAKNISKNKNITIITIKNSTHLFPIEKHLETSQLIKRFLLK